MHQSKAHRAQQSRRRELQPFPGELAPHAASLRSRPSAPPRAFRSEARPVSSRLPHGPNSQPGCLGADLRERSRSGRAGFSTAERLQISEEVRMGKERMGEGAFCQATFTTLGLCRTLLHLVCEEKDRKDNHIPSISFAWPICKAVFPAGILEHEKRL